MFANRQLGFIYQTMKYLSYIPAHNNLITTKKIHYILFLHNNIYFNTSLFEYLISNIKITNVFVSPTTHDPHPASYYITSAMLSHPVDYLSPNIGIRQGPSLRRYQYIGKLYTAGSHQARHGIYIADHIHDGHQQI